ncbi:putative GATA transcription factor 22 [Neltuma alba]|uniref:putative GATA transcription factor 22 n=1 Tax=Neltuma alba TaxID=207710 RepID=UPI0010A46602|nr:putative GATA transcription factor 22 [Prosopis alba]
MTPAAMNPSSPFLLRDQIEDQNQLFVSPLNRDSANSLSSCPSFFRLLDQTQTRETRSELRHDQEEAGLMLHGGSSSHQVWNSPFNSRQPQQVKDDRRNVCGGYKEEDEEEESKSGYESAEWMPSKIRLMRKMMIPNTSHPVPRKESNITPNTQTREHQKTQTHKSPPNHRNNTTTTRVCADCNTTSTPLWRGGPKGPKSLCNACGIRQRKARRALMAEAGNGVVSCRLNSKEKRARTNNFAALKNKCKATAAGSAGMPDEGERKNIGLTDLAYSLRNNVSVVEQVFPADEVAQAALLLMDLSYASIPV